MIMYRMDKTYNFHISREESQAILVLREHNINISRFLRMSLRDLADKLQNHDEEMEEDNRLS